MKHPSRRSLLLLVACPMVGLLFADGCSDSPSGTTTKTLGSGGQTTTGGTSPATSGSAGGIQSGTGGKTGSGGSTPVGAGGATTTSSGGTTISGSGGAIGTGGSVRTGGTTAGTGGSGGAGGKTASTGGATAGSGGRGGTGGLVAGTGGAAGADGTISACGSSTLNENPFGCSFAWGLSDPGTPLSPYSFLQFTTSWIEWGIKADGTFTTCNGCNWLKSTVAPTSLVPVYYAYIIGYMAHAAGLVDGNQCPSNHPNCPNLTNDGGKFIKDNRSKIVQAYADYAKQSYAVWPTKPLVWLLEGDYIQFTDTAQGSPLTMSQLATLTVDIVCAIKGNMPNAVVAINHTTWNGNAETNAYWNAMKSAGVNYDMVWTTGVANKNGFFNADITSGSYNGTTANYAYVHKLTGKTILVDDSCGAEANETWSTASAATLNAHIASGVIAFNHCGKLKSTYQSLITALKPQLDPTCN